MNPKVLIALVVFSVILSSCARESAVPDSLGQRCESLGGKWIANFSECEVPSKEACDELGGSYDECDSACRHDPGGGPCIAVCVQVCSIGR